MRRKTTARHRSRRVGAAHHKTRARRRRRVSGIGSGLIMDAAALVAGAVGGRIVSNLALKQFPAISATIVNVAEIGLGAYLMNSGKSSTIKYLGAGMIAGGGQLALVNLGVISGAKPVSYRIHGTPNFHAINGSPNFKAVNGVKMPEFENWQKGLKSISKHPDSI